MKKSSKKSKRERGRASLMAVKQYPPMRREKDTFIIKLAKRYFPSYMELFSPDAFFDLIPKVHQKKAIHALLPSFDTLPGSDENRMAYLAHAMIATYAFAQWDQTKTIHLMDRELHDALMKADYKDITLPKEIPFPSTYVHFPSNSDYGSAGTSILVGFYWTINTVIINGDEQTLNVITVVNKDNRDFLQFDIASGENFDETLKRNNQLVSEEQGLFVKCLKAVYLIMAYILSEKSDKTEKQKGKFVVSVTNKVKSENNFNEIPAVVYVGKQVGDRIRQNESTIVSLRERNTPIPHIRKGHWHSYWTGPRDGVRKKVLKWVEMTFVNASSAEELPIKVKKI